MKETCIHLGLLACRPMSHLSQYSCLQHETRLHNTFRCNLRILHKLQLEVNIETTLGDKASSV